MVAIEFGMWRSVRSGGAAGSVTVGNGKFFEPPGGTSSTGGNRLPLGDQEAVGRDGQRRMVMKAAPSAALEMAQPNLLLELLIIALDAPAQFGDVDQAIEGDGVWERREPVFGRLGLALRPLYQQPFRRMRLTSLFVVMSDANTQARKARDQRLGRAFAPFDRGDAVSEELAAAMKRIGELTMENEVLRARVGHVGPLVRRRSR